MAVDSAPNTTTVVRDVLADTIERWIGERVDLPSAFDATVDQLVQLERLPVRQLALALVETAVRGSADAGLRGHHYWARLAEWYGAAEPVEASSESTDPAETEPGEPLMDALGDEQEVVICEPCGDDLSPDDIEVGDLLCVECREGLARDHRGER